MVILSQLKRLVGPSVKVYWLLGSSVRKQAHPDGKRSSFPACKHRLVGVLSDVINSRLMLEQCYFSRNGWRSFLYGWYFSLSPAPLGRLLGGAHLAFRSLDQTAKDFLAALHPQRP